MNDHGAQNYILFVSNNDDNTQNAFYDGHTTRFM